MKRKKPSVGKPIRNTSSAVFLSALIHIILLAIAGGFVVFTVIKKEERKFVPPQPVKRQKMELKRPRVKVKKTIRPQSSQRISAQSTRQGLPKIEQPSISSFSSGFAGNVGNTFEMMPDPSELGLFGGTSSLAIGNDFEGTFYSFELDRRGRSKPISTVEMDKVVNRFMDAGWNPRVLAPYYRSPQKLYTTHLMIPPIPSERGPEQFGVNLGEKISPAFWMIHYKGRIASKKGGTFRFWGAGDNFMVLRVNKKVVLLCSFAREPHPRYTWRSNCEDSREESGKHMFGHGFAWVGDWFTLEPGVPVEMEAIFGDYEGGWFLAMVTVEEKGKKYRRNQDGLPILPAFKTAEFPPLIKNQLEYLLTPDEVLLDDPLMFNVN